MHLALHFVVNAVETSVCLDIGVLSISVHKMMFVLRFNLCLKRANRTPHEMNTLISMQACLRE